MIDVVDALRELARTVLPTGTVVDEACAAPLVFEPGLYAWNESVAHRSIGTGEVREDFIVYLVYVVDHAGEESSQRRSRDVSVALDAGAVAMCSAINANANVPPWASGNIIGETDPDFLRQLEVRGTAVRVTGYRLIS